MRNHRRQAYCLVDRSAVDEGSGIAVAGPGRPDKPLYFLAKQAVPVVLRHQRSTGGFTQQRSITLQVARRNRYDALLLPAQHKNALEAGQFRMGHDQRVGALEIALFVRKVVPPIVIDDC